MLLKQWLLALNVDHQIRVGLIQIMNSHVFDILDRSDQLAFDARALKGGVGEKNKHAGQRLPQWHGAAVPANDRCLPEHSSRVNQSEKS